MNRTQFLRFWVRSGFFALFLLAPVLDLFRLDLTQGHFIVFGQAWTIGLHDVDDGAQVLRIFVRVFLPLLALLTVGFWVTWRYGRLYCGWLCPHFSVVETVNALMRRASGKISLWDRQRPPIRQNDGTAISPRSANWWFVALAVVGFAFIWATTLLTYLLPPTRVWGHLFSWDMTRGEMLFVLVGSALFTIDFLLARHLFCRFGCAVGFFQSLIWMANPKAMVIGFDRHHASACADCDASCEHACPMRLKPRLTKRHLLACTQCQQCVQACDRTRYRFHQRGVLRPISGEAALDASRRDFGRRPPVPEGTYQREFDKREFRFHLLPTSVDRNLAPGKDEQQRGTRIRIARTGTTENRRKNSTDQKRP